MRTTTRVIWLLLPLLVVGTSLTLTASSEEMRAGVVAGLQGSAKVHRTSLTQPRELRIKDDVYLRDEIVTGENSMARILLGGKALLTVRERSIVKITEAPGVSTVSVSSGRAAVNVIKERMRPGDAVEIVTPNAVAAIRGTIVVAEVEPDATATRSTITVLRGLIDVLQRDDSGRTPGSPVSVSALQQVVAVGPRLSAVHAISRQTADRLSNDFKMGLRTTPTAPGMVQTEVDRAAQSVAGVKDSAAKDSKDSGGDAKAASAKGGDAKGGDGGSTSGGAGTAGGCTSVASGGSSGGTGSNAGGSANGTNAGGGGSTGGGAVDRIASSGGGVDRVVVGGNGNGNGNGNGGGDRDHGDRGNRDRGSKKR